MLHQGYEEDARFLHKYLSLPSLKRLAGVGLLCGTDWTPLYQNDFFYSRLDHSIGVALIIWHFTHDKAQSLSGLFHDISTPAFSHVGDFRKGDALTQQATEDDNKVLVDTDEGIGRLLLQDGLTANQVDDYHQYPIADNDIPHLSADRLEYMFPSGMLLKHNWTLEEIKTVYDDITICKNQETGQLELGFKHKELAELYCQRFCDISLVLLHNENKIALSLLGAVLDKAIACHCIKEEDILLQSELALIERFDAIATSPRNEDENVFARYYYTFRSMTAIERSDAPMADAYCVSMPVKKRYIDPLVIENNSDSVGIAIGIPVSQVSKKAAQIVSDFLSFEDSPYGCVPFVSL
ncbi:MAG: hypothetical protein K6E51_13030 [Treponema sp.]|nr:hypothetical protein [Treponema sp.]